jgi:hypothetical protein
VAPHLQPISDGKMAKSAPQQDIRPIMQAEVLKL